MSMAQNPLAGRTAFQIDALFAIDHVETNGTTREMAAGYDAPSGQCIRQRLELTRDEDVNAGRLYPSLDELVDDGLVERGQIDRRTNSYELTEDGVQALEEYREFVGA